MLALVAVFVIVIAILLRNRFHSEFSSHGVIIAHFEWIGKG